MFHCSSWGLSPHDFSAVQSWFNFFLIESPVIKILFEAFNTNLFWTIYYTKKTDPFHFFLFSINELLLAKISSFCPNFWHCIKILYFYTHTPTCLIVKHQLSLFCSWIAINKSCLMILRFPTSSFGDLADASWGCLRVHKICCICHNCAVSLQSGRPCVPSGFGQISRTCHSHHICVTSCLCGWACASSGFQVAQMISRRLCICVASPHCGWACASSSLGQMNRTCRSHHICVASWLCE